MLNRKLTSAALAMAVASALGTAQAQAEEDSFYTVSANVAVTSDYRFRGISQTDEDFAIQGGFDVEFTPGFYIGVWGSTVDFDTNGPGFDGSLELDYYFGWGSTIGSSGDLSIDVGYIYYDYPGDDGDEGDYQEVQGNLSWKDLTVGANYSDDYYGETGDFWYLYADYGLSLPGDFGLSFHIGYNDIEKNGGFLATDEDSYIDYSIGISKELWAVEWALTWVGTDLDEEDVFDTDWGEDTVVFSIAKSL